MNTVTNVIPLSGNRLLLTFADGFEAEVELKPLLSKGIAIEITSPERFAEVSKEPGGGITWPNGFDLCPEFLRKLAENRQAAA